MNHNSTVVALDELMKLEAQRVQKLEDQARAEAESEARSREAAERAKRAQQARIRAAAQERLRREREQLEHEQREERIRIAEAEARSRAEAEARLREEQMRLETQIKLSRRKQTPYWLYATAAALTLGLLGGGVYTYQARQAAEAERQRIAAELAVEREALRELDEHARALQGDLEANAARQLELEDRLKQAKDEQERAAIASELEAKKRENQDLASRLNNNRDRRRNGGKGSGKGSGKGTGKGSGHSNPLVIDNGDGGPL